MRAHDIQVAIEMIDRRRPLAVAGRMIVDHGRIGVVVAGADGSPQGLISVHDVFRLALPEYLLDDPSLAATVDEQSTVEMIEALREKSIDEAIRDGAVRLRPVPDVDSNATVLEIAAILVSNNCMIATVAGTTGSDARFVTLPAVLDAVLGLSDSDTDTDTASGNA